MNPIRLGAQALVLAPLCALSLGAAAQTAFPAVPRDVPARPAVVGAPSPAAQAASAAAAGTTRLPIAAYQPPAPTEVERVWEVKVADVTLAKTLERWGAEMGVRVRWDAAKTFLVGAPDTFRANFDGAVSKVLSSPGIVGSDYPLEACLYANNPPLLRVTRMGEQTKDCQQ